jgi:hypothetical protein
MVHGMQRSPGQLSPTMKPMNAPHGSNTPARSPASRFLIPAVSLVTFALFAPAVAAGTQDPGTTRSDVSKSPVTTMPEYSVEEALSAKTHTLFMGADIAINLDRDLYRVRDVMGSNWVIEINGREREVSAKEAPLNLKVTPNLKLTENSATIVGFKRVQAYSFANDPSVMLTRGLNRSASMSSDLTAVARNAQARADTLANSSLGGAAYLAGADDQFSANALMTTAQFAYSNTHNNPLGATFGPNGLPLPSPYAPSTTTAATNVLPDMVFTLGSSKGMFVNPTQSLNTGIAQGSAAGASSQTENGNEPTGRLATGGLDAIDVEFDIRSAKMLQNPYVVTMTRFRAAGAKPGMVQNMVYARSLHPIDEHLSHVHFVQEGFPFGFELIDFQLHVYNRGEEIATNIAADRVELTREEAFEYVKMEYMGAHPKDTLPAAPVMGKLPSDLPSLLAKGRYAGSFYVKVSPDGLSNGAYSDPACTRKIDDPYLDSVVTKVRFKPALNKGKPVEGIAVLNLNKLTL